MLRSSILQLCLVSFNKRYDFLFGHILRNSFSLQFLPPCGELFTSVFSGIGFFWALVYLSFTLYHLKTLLTWFTGTFQDYDRRMIYLNMRKKCKKCSVKSQTLWDHSRNSSWVRFSVSRNILELLFKAVFYSFTIYPVDFIVFQLINQEVIRYQVKCFPSALVCYSNIFALAI